MHGSGDPDQSNVLSVNYIQDVLKQAFKNLEQEQKEPELFKDTSSPIGQVTAGLGKIIKNAAHPTDDLFGFLEDYAGHAGLSAVAIMMWGWSDHFGDTVEKRLSSVDHPNLRQLSMALVSAAGGYS